VTVLALAATIWAAVTGFYGTRNWTPVDVCKATYMGEDFALVQARIRGVRHIAALHFLNAKRGWVVMWADGGVNPKIGPYTRSLVQGEVTRLKAKCLAP
jgi:hypothetical protein